MLGKIHSRARARARTSAHPWRLMKVRHSHQINASSLCVLWIVRTDVLKRAHLIDRNRIVHKRYLWFIANQPRSRAFPSRVIWDLLQFVALQTTIFGVFSLALDYQVFLLGQIDKVISLLCSSFSWLEHHFIGIILSYFNHNHDS